MRIGLFTVVAAAASFLCSCSLQRALSADKSAYLTADEMAEKYSAGGIVESRMYKSSVGGPSERRMIVYLPADYYKDSSKSYPVAYVFHGARGNESSWVKDGDMFRIVDSLLATGEMMPSIIVLPNMNQYDDDADGFQSRFKRPMESFFETDGAVETGFPRDVVAFVDSLYRTVPDKKHRAIAGLSIGGIQSIYISAENPDMFGYVGLFSPMYKAPVKHSAYSSFYGYKSLKDKQKRQFSDPPELYFIGIGKADIFYHHIRRYRRYLEDNGYRYYYEERAGGHNWANWKVFFTDFLKKLYERVQAG